jgi:hypothetical protein
MRVQALVSRMRRAGAKRRVRAGEVCAWTCSDARAYVTSVRSPSTPASASRCSSAALPRCAKAILAEADRGTQEYRNLEGDRVTRLKVGISANFGAYILPDVLQRYFGAHPDFPVDVQTGHAEHLVASCSARRSTSRC